jgi:flagellar biosynthesis protein FlhB
VTEKSLPPSEERLRRARAEGTVALSWRASLAAALVTVTWTAPAAVASLREGFGTSFGAAVRAAGEGSVRLTPGDALRAVGVSALGATALVLGAATAAYLAVSGAQTRFLFAWPKRSGNARPDADRLASVVWVTALFAVGAHALWTVAHSRGLVARTPSLAVAVWGDLLAGVFARVAFAALTLGAMDVLYRRWTLRRDLRMTRDEARREARESEGDPTLRARLRRRSSE